MRKEIKHEEMFTPQYTAFKMLEESHAHFICQIHSFVTAAWLKSGRELRR